MGMIRGIASIAADYADTLPNGQRGMFLAQCGHAAATIRGEYDKSPSFINHKARMSDPGPQPPGPLARCAIELCDNPRRGERLYCTEHLAVHYARMVETCGMPDAAAAAMNSGQDRSLEQNPRHPWNDFKEADDKN